MSKNLIGSFSIAWYGLILSAGVLLGLAMACYVAKKSGQSTDTYVDLAMAGVIVGIVCARAYYVAFSWDAYRDHPLEILNLRGGGLAIYGGVIGAVLTVLVFSRLRRIPFGRLWDTTVFGLVTGQIVGRWGNFVNCEAFGGYTDSLLAMRLNTAQVNSYMITPELWERHIVEDGVTYIQVHPTFLYESLWNLGLLALMLLWRRHRRWEGELSCLYVAGYGLGRFWIEGLRTDQLTIGGSGIAVSQVIALISALAALGILLFQRRRAARQHEF